MLACKGKTLYSAQETEPVEKAVYLSLLLDFFGELLTEKQREYADLYYNENLSLRETEEKTGLLARHTRLQQQIAEAEASVQEIRKLNAERLQDARLLSLCAELESKLDQMKL